MTVSVKTGKKDVRGTYVHHRIVPIIASWLCPVFAVKVSGLAENRFIHDLFIGKHELAKVEDEYDEYKRSMNSLLAQVSAYLNDVKKVYGKNIKQIERISRCDDIDSNSVDTTKKDKKNIDAIIKNYVFYVVKYNNKGHYCVVRTEQSLIKSKIKALIKNYPKMTIIYKIIRTPYSVNLWTKIRSDLEKHKNINANGCDFELTNCCTEKKMLQVIQKIHDDHTETV